MASMTPLRFGGDSRLHLFDCLRSSCVRKRTEDVLGSSRREHRRRLQENALRRIFHGQPRAGLPSTLLADRFGQDDLTFRRNDGGEFCCGGHDPFPSKTMVRYRNMAQKATTYHLGFCSMEIA